MPALTAAAPVADPLALYIHWPFCVSKCPYCDFNSHVRASINEQAWQDALIADLRHEAQLLPGRRLGSIFFGGGTPSLMPPRLVAALIEEAARLWPFEPDIEITLEANPSSVEASRFEALAQAGVNRVSLGVQSLDAEALHLLGRAHGVAEALAAIGTAQRHFGRVSIDLIYARPGQSATAWESELNQALALGTGHLSLYQLTIEPGTRFETLVRQGTLIPADDDHSADLYALTDEITRQAGLPVYEISNHARPGEESRHNLAYWRYQDYAGIGPGAHGRRRNQATVRHRKPENFLNALARNGHGLSAETDLSPETRAIEALLMGLRLAEGIDAEALAAWIGLAGRPLIDAHAAARLEKLGLVASDRNQLRVTPAGRPLLNALLTELVAVEADAPA